MMLLEALARAEAITIRPVLEIVSDPMALLEDAAEVTARIDTGGRGRCSWMARLQAGGGAMLDATPAGGAPQLFGRTCCYEHMRRYEGRQDLALPFEATCPACRRVFRVKLGVVDARRR